MITDDDIRAAFRAGLICEDLLQAALGELVTPDGREPRTPDAEEIAAAREDVVYRIADVEQRGIRWRRAPVAS